MSRVTARRRMQRVSPAGLVQRPDTLAVEEPLEIRVDGEPLTITMRTPGSDIDLVHGFLFAEGVIGAAEDIVAARYCAGTDDEGRNTYNVLDVTLRAPAPVHTRNFLTTSACGLCGKSALEEVRTRTRFPLPAPEVLVDVDTLAGLPDTLRARQSVFDATGGLHAAGLFAPDGAALAVREDIGRHNAVDKVVGWAVREARIPAGEVVLVVSGRASFELVQKAVMAGIPLLAAVSAPSSLAVDLAAESGLTLAGFVRGETMNIYTHPDRINTAPTANSRSA
ncbi:formate dehydrogenase accessory sulfurtransferase FdhD [Nocardia cyriacigeorgica]|uniref:Sulfur carrier protein FdhD n=1 Tax=Nocardia cyriacigeorgica TaxID=135487 RepID=A0A6P1D4X8_9NOCA|nr:formate dehydrogenase accessory sulfurtransferase FdhD [Nocardia cyriacigeorgica]NEW40627.1 formate dehydrogenase accessory sulfurtransferase FdhD [Nocardia cyriacigeorgica]NEW45098.1 formate dehydrogenase accessory sulfurtransferase FdhD [Nocardia cyriacigeorgica]NEW51145.1 formate dehydrogenase accessory sulfurtransferase FdhD [Nocardia cyriacigeorgica]NEW54270.1 formate dehydrogenase accessory sulfurtransferase FdhD [Nocardia cyriacigeorgica]